MIPLLLTCTLFAVAIASATVLFLRKLTRKEKTLFWISVDISKATESLNTLSNSMHRASLAFMAFSADVERLENPALKHWAKTQP